MRCPKCHYLSFEPEPRCKNCGYDLAFDASDVVVKAPSAVEPEEVLPDLDLRIRESEPVAPAPAALSMVTPVPTTELPLFVQGIPAEALDEPVVVVAEVDEPLESVEFDEPLVKLPPAPRAPLSVRRPTPAPGRVRERYHKHTESGRQIGLLERDVLQTPSAPDTDTPWPLIRPDEINAPQPEPVAAAAADQERWIEPVGAGRRLEAAFVDVLFLGSINAAIVWLTLQRCDLTWSQIGSLPILPVAALLFLLDALYLLMFTATNGQTVGKMAAHIRVVGESADAMDRITLKQALLRAVLTFPSVLVLGAGFLPGLIGRGVALHDRFTHTRVVRA